MLFVRWISKNSLTKIAATRSHLSCFSQTNRVEKLKLVPARMRMVVSNTNIQQKKKRRLNNIRGYLYPRDDIRTQKPIRGHVRHSGHVSSSRQSRLCAHATQWNPRGTYGKTLAIPLPQISYNKCKRKIDSLLETWKGGLWHDEKCFIIFSQARPWPSIIRLHD